MVGVALLVGTAFQSWQLSREDAMSHITGIIRGSHRIVVGCERYVTGSQTIKKTRQVDALEVCDEVRQLCTQHPHATFRLQGAGDAKKRVGSTKNLRELGWYRRGQVHANDAASHVALALLSTYPATYERLLRPDKVQVTQTND
jgi:hypothetical protein